MDLLPQLLPDTESPMLPTLKELLELPLLLSQLLLEDMLELVGMLPTLLELSMLPSVRLRLSLRLKLMLVFFMELMAMVPVLDMLDLDMDILVLDMLDMVVMDLAMAVLAMLVLVTMARGLLMLSQRLMLVFTMEDMAMVPVLDMLDLDMDIPVLDMLGMEVMDLDTVLDMLGMVVMDLDTVLDMDVPSTVKQLIYTSKSSKVIFLLFSALLRGRNFVFHVRIK